MASTKIRSDNSEHERLFGFETSGLFRCPYSAEKFFTVLLIAAAIGGCAGIYIFAKNIAYGDKDTYAFVADVANSDKAAFFVALTLLIGAAIWLAICFIVFRLVIRGSEYCYKADESKLTIIHGQQSMDFFYSNIFDVQFEPLMLLKWQRGFTVTVVTRKGSYTFKYLYDNLHSKMAPETTAFFILKERAGLNQQADPDLYFKHKRENAAAREAALERPVAYHERSALAAEPVRISVKDDKDIVISKGSFRAPRSILNLVALIAALCGAAVLFFFIVWFLLRNNVLQGLISILLTAALLVILVGLYRAVSYIEMTYEATKSEFRVTDPKGGRDVIYYQDVDDVRYTPLRRLGRQCGYNVSIITKYRTITYKYLFIKNKSFQAPSETPFDIIKQNLPD